MGFLHKLWDETVAGPPPESGLGRLRKYDSFSNAKATPIVEVPAVTRSITILRAKSALPNLSVDPGSASESPATPGTPCTPMSPKTPPGGELKRFTRRKFPDEAVQHAEPRSPTVYDWFSLIVLFILWRIYIYRMMI